MELIFEILRREKGAKSAVLQRFCYEFDDPNETVATALTAINEREPLIDADGQIAAPIRWDCGCLQKRCGACAMVINGRPGLACAVRLADAGKRIRLEPLKKFPVVEDLVVNRSIMHENLIAIRLWLEAPAALDGSKAELNHEASRCMQCGCCLEVCPNFASGGAFTGMAAAVPLARLISEASGKKRREAAEFYRKRVFEGCGKSLACRNICPAKLDVDALLVNSNAAAVWKNYFKKG